MKMILTFWLYINILQTGIKRTRKPKKVDYLNTSKCIKCTSINTKATYNKYL